MSKNTFYPQTYKCPEGHITKHYVWSKEIETTKHQCYCEAELTVDNVHVEETAAAPAKIGMTKEEIKADRQKRSHEHFRREVYPTIPKADRKFFAQKHGLKT